MENVIISKVCGLCAGCKNAIDTAKNCKLNKDVVLFKEIVHNKNVNKYLGNLGILTTNDLSSIKNNQCVVLRAHGEPPETYDYLKKHSIDFIDCTCQNVTKIHENVREYSSKNYTIIIIGKYGKTNSVPHPEIVGTIGWCQTPPILIETIDDIDKINCFSKTRFYLVCQTTFNEKLADEFIFKITQICKDNNNELIINKSICNAQKAINIASAELAKTRDIMIVVGGKNSSNSLELFNNVKQYTNSIFIENINEWLDEINKNNFNFSKTTRIGITAGASTLKEELVELKKFIEQKQKEF